jgi:hypothetical protein
MDLITEMNTAFLKSIIENRFFIPEHDKVTQLTPTLLKNLGAVEWELRDYSYMILTSWIGGGREFNG